MVIEENEGGESSGGVSEDKNSSIELTIPALQQEVIKSVESGPLVHEALGKANKVVQDQEEVIKQLKTFEEVIEGKRVSQEIIQGETNKDDLPIEDVTADVTERSNTSVNQPQSHMTTTEASQHVQDQEEVNKPPESQEFTHEDDEEVIKGNRKTQDITPEVHEETNEDDLAISDAVDDLGKISQDQEEVNKTPESQESPDKEDEEVIEGNKDKQDIIPEAHEETNEDDLLIRFAVDDPAKSSQITPVYLLENHMPMDEMSIISCEMQWLFVILIPVIFGITVFIRRRMNHNYQRLRNDDYDYDLEDLNELELGQKTRHLL